MNKSFFFFEIQGRPSTVAVSLEGHEHGESAWATPCMRAQSGLTRFVTYSAGRNSIANLSGPPCVHVCAYRVD